MSRFAMRSEGQCVNKCHSYQTKTSHGLHVLLYFLIKSIHSIITFLRKFKMQTWAIPDHKGFSNDTCFTILMNGQGKSYKHLVLLCFWFKNKMGIFYCCCDIDLIKVGKVITIVEIILDIVIFTTGIIVAGFDDKEVLFLIIISLIIPYLMELLGLYTKFFAILCLNVVIRLAMFVSSIVLDTKFYKSIKEYSNDFFSHQ